MNADCGVCGISRHERAVHDYNKGRNTVEDYLCSPCFSWSYNYGQCLIGAISSFQLIDWMRRNLRASQIIDSTNIRLRREGAI